MGSAAGFPREYARTGRFTLGTPRAFTVAPDGSRVVFLRSRAGDDRTGCLYSMDPATGAERLLVDPDDLLSAGEELSAAERALRERRREQGAGVVGYATDAAVSLAAFALSGRLFVTDLAGGRTRELPARTPVVDPRPDPTGRHVAYVSAGTLRVVGTGDDDGDRALAEPDGDQPGEVSYGLAEFVAAEEMDRTRGYWWSPDGRALLVTRVDNAPVQRWYLADPAEPAAEPATLRYPSAGTPNARVTAFVLGLDGSRAEVRWDTSRFEYLAAAHWSAGGPPLLAVQTRDQRTVRVLAADPATGATSIVVEDTDPCWVDLVPGTPALTGDGRCVRVVARDGAYRLVVGDRELTGGPLQVCEVLDVGERDVLVSGWDDDPTSLGVYRVDLTSAAGDGAVEPVSDRPGVHTAVRAGGVTVLGSSGPDWSGQRTRVLVDGRPERVIATHAHTPPLTPRVTWLTVGERGLRCALVLPTGYRPGSGPLPVLLDPYGGPHAQRVVATANAYLVPQWFAEAGFAVLVADGRGTPGRGPDWDRLVAGDFGATLADQVDALHAVAAQRPELDLTRVAIRGWSFGGYLAARAVLDRPEVFHAAVAGAPVTDWRMYTTHYTERYLGDPAARSAGYDADSLLAAAPTLRRPLMLIHGLADDNVISAHTLRLSAALLAAGRPHTVLPLTGTSHMTTLHAVTENLLVLQRDFLLRALAAPR
ncbi:MAG TPA: prolyl oligopeptidase family serine peptidase [Mycobacteriales bacterium]|nr:prolyl oligopeptidase family serine peptidase [Mycobacteriales bacterium]